MKKFLDSQKKTDLPSFHAGDVIKVYQQIEENGKTRIQPFEGLVIARKHGQEIGATFTVRKKIDGVGTEKIFPLHSPTIQKIKIVKAAKKRTSSKLYWTRHKSEKDIQKKLRLEHSTKKDSSAQKEKTDQKDEIAQKEK